MNKVDKAVAAYRNLQLKYSQYRNIRKIADSSIPKFKQKKFDDLTTQALVARTNAANELDYLKSKLNMGEQLAFSQQVA